MGLEAINGGQSYKLTDSTGEFSFKINQEQQEVLQKEINDALGVIDDAAKEKDTAAAEAKDDEIKTANEVLDTAQKELDEAKEQADKYDYEKQGFGGLKGKYDYQDKGMSNKEIAQMYKNDYYGVDSDGDGEIDGVQFNALDYDSVSEDEVKTLEDILEKDPGDWSTNDKKTVDTIMEKMAKEAKSDTSSVLSSEQQEFSAAKEQNEKEIAAANEKYEAALKQNADEAQALKEQKEAQIYDDAVEGVTQEGAKSYFEKLSKGE